MLKKLSVVALAGLLALPGVAGAAPSADELAGKIDKLTKELETLRQQMKEMKENNEMAVEAVENVKEKSESWDLASRIQISGDFRSRLDWVHAETPQHYSALTIGQGVADFMTLGTVMDRWDADSGGAQLLATFAAGGTGWGAYDTATNSIAAPGPGTPVSDAEAAAVNRAFGSGTFNAILGGILVANPATPVAGMTPNFANLQNVTTFMKSLTVAQRMAIFNEMGYSTTAAADYDNDTLWTNRLRLNLRAKATENVTFKGRLAMYKAWGMQNNPVDYTFNNNNGGGPFMLSSLSFDGSAARQPNDSALLVDRAYVNWANIADLPIWFSIGRRPTTDGPPGHLRQGSDERMATPTAYMDYPFDGLTLGYAYWSLFGIEDFPGRIRFCYGRGFDSGPTQDGDGLHDVDFAGISWDVYNKGDRFIAFQSFAAFDMFNVPDDITFVNPVEFYLWRIDPGRYNPLDPSADNILNRKNLGNIYHTTATYMDKYDSLNYFVSAGWSQTDPNGMDEMGTSLLGSFYDPVDRKDGYSVYAGLRYDMPEKRLKLGLEYNWGSENWIAFTPGHDDIYQSKLATRGSVAEAYMIYDFPAGEKLNMFSKFFMRAGYMHYWYDYTGSGFWLGKPVDIDDLKNDPLNAQFYTPIDSIDQVYLTIETYF